MPLGGVHTIGSEHRWFEDRADPCTLLVVIDDATWRLMQLRFVPSESAFAYFGALQGYLETHGCPVAFYSDKHSVFRVTRQDAKGGQGMTQFGRALAELNIEILCAHSSQAKGRVERANRTLQDRLVKELRMAGISDLEAGNAFLPGFMVRFNARFAVVPARPDDRHRPLNMAPERLRAILCRREQRYVGQQLALSYDRQRLILERNEATEGPRRQARRPPGTRPRAVRLMGKRPGPAVFCNGAGELTAAGRSWQLRPHPGRVRRTPSHLRPEAASRPSRGDPACPRAGAVTRA